MTKRSKTPAVPATEAPEVEDQAVPQAQAQPLVPAGFDYSDLAPEIAAEARGAAERIKVRMRRTAEDIVEIGRDLSVAKACLPHGGFVPWIKREFGMTDRTAQNFMRVFQLFGSKTEIISDLGTTALIALASAPPEAVAAIETRVEAGESLTVADVKAEIAAARAAAAEAEARARDAEDRAAAVAEDLESLRQLSNEKKAAASRREANLIADKRAAEAALAAAEAERAAAIAEAGLRAQAALADQIAAAQADAEAARAALAAAEAEADARLTQARAEAEAAAQAQAEALAKAALEEEGEAVKRLRAEAERAQKDAEKARKEINHIATKLGCMKVEIANKEEILRKLNHVEEEGLEQMKMAERLSEDLTTAMLNLTMFEAGPQEVSRRKMEVLADTAEKFSRAVRAFLAPRLAGGQAFDGEVVDLVDLAAEVVAAAEAAEVAA